MSGNTNSVWKCERYFQVLDSYQNKMLVLTNFQNVLSSSFTSMKSFLNILVIWKKINQRKILFLLSNREQPIQQEEKKKTKLSKKLG